LWEYNADTNASRQLTSAGNMPIKVANNDWVVSPNGQAIAFVESRDDNIWVLKLKD
jgi:Tol biopolymer transport system component